MENLDPAGAREDEGYPGALTIKLVRHGESEANVGRASPQEVGDHNVALTERGRAQARAAGVALGRAFLHGAQIYCSPYRRTRETLDQLCRGAGYERGAAALRVLEDPRLREVEHGYFDYEAQQEDRALHGWFYYRFRGGESPADCYDRTSGFLDSLIRQVERKDARRVLIVSHGLTIRCFVMRFMHMTVEAFEELANPGNAAVITIGPSDQLAAPRFTCGRWGVDGVELRT
ncbi:MAG: histidine phosphatase family protein [Myxococcales bacterium]|nr:histidine phosphatase family protein [Myxococcales bacterium]MCB9749123.1 histidine phosphatase family protein [Myxococcales bacterium]